MSRMMCYAWLDKDGNKGEVKFGDHFVPTACSLDEAVLHTEAYIQLQFPRRAAHYRSDRVIWKVWDVSAYAKKHNKFKAHSHIDDVIRPAIGFSGTVGREFHALSFDEVCIRVNKELAKHEQPLIPAALSTKQHDVAVEVLKMFEKDPNAVVLAELCARFGKTIWSGAVAHEMDKDLIIVASYVKTVFTSFAKDLTNFQQFAGYAHVDAGEKDYQMQIESAFNSGRKVVVYLSMANGSKRQERIDYLFSWENSILVVDEADFGSHTPNQADPLIAATGGAMPVLIMTGTNSDRAATHWAITQMTSVTYPELLIQKRNSKPIRSQLAHFKVDHNRDALAPEFECYQMNLSGPVDKAIAAGEVSDDFRELPSWSKFGAAPIKSKGFFVRVLEAVFLNKGGHDELNVELQTETIPDQRVAMMFLGARRNEALNQAAKIAEQALPGYKVIALNGDATHNGKKIKNRNAEQFVKEVVSTGENVLILSNNMAQRSFSIPEITELYLAYDQGAEGATIQKMSRTLTPGEVGKVGRIFSLSFDPNRDDKFDAMIVETALNHKARGKAKSLREAMRDVLRTIDIFACTEDGAVKIEIDDYLEKALARKGISRVLGKIVDISQLSANDITALANGDGDYFRAAKVEGAQKGKTREAKQKAKSANKKDNASAKEIAKARETIVQIVENMDVILFSGTSDTIADALQELDNDEDRAWVLDEFGVDLDVVYHLFDSGIIRQDWIELIHEG